MARKTMMLGTTVAPWVFQKLNEWSTISDLPKSDIITMLVRMHQDDLMDWDEERKFFLRKPDDARRG